MTRRARSSGEAREVALAEAQAVLALVAGRDPARPARRARRRRRRGRARGDDADALERAARARAPDRAASARSTAPGGEQAALRAYRQLPRGAELARERARGDRGAARRSTAGRSTPIAVEPSGPGAYALSLDADGAELPSARPPGRAPRERWASELMTETDATTWPASTSRAAAASSSAAARSRSRRRRACSTCGARVTVVAPRAVAGFAALDVELRATRRTEPADLDGRFLVVAATSTTSVNRRVFADAEARGLSATSPTCPSSATSSSRRSTAQGRSRSPSRPAARRPRSRSACGRVRGARRPRARRARRAACARCGRGRRRTFPTYEERRDLFQPSSSRGRSQ